MNVPKNLIFIHGLMGSSLGVKATLLREMFPDIIVPDFRGELDDRLRELESVLENRLALTIIGSSFGGLMGALYACEHPQQVNKLVLLAPALIWPEFASHPPAPSQVPAIIYHGSGDEIIPLDLVRELAERVFMDLDFHVVDDDHGLYKTVHELDWKSLLAG